MSEAQPGNAKPYDPLEPFRGMRDAYLDAMSKTMVEAVNTEAYAKASGAILDSSLTMSAPFREGLEKSMLQVLQQLSLPSRQDILGLAERFTNMEMRLDDMDACLDGMESGFKETMPAILAQMTSLNKRFTHLETLLDELDLSQAPGTGAARTPSATRGTGRAHAIAKRVQTGKPSRRTAKGAQ